MKMKKQFTRVLTLCLMLVMVASLVPVTASASYLLQVEYDNSQTGVKHDDAPWNNFLDVSYKELADGATLKASDYDKYIRPYEDKSIILEFSGIGGWQSAVGNGVTELKVPPFPADGNEEEKEAWHASYGFLFVDYMQHEHNLRTAPWYADNNYHWKRCTECGHKVFQEWHSDKNEDGICDFCDNPIHYYNITLKDTPGGKVTLSAEKGAMNDRINVTVTPDAGYHLGEIHFYNKNEQHSELTRWERKIEEGYYFIILNWDIEVEATFVKD